MFSLQVQSNIANQIMATNFLPEEHARLLQTIPTYTTFEVLSKSLQMPTMFQQNIPIGLANISSSKCESDRKKNYNNQRHIVHATTINKKRRDKRSKENDTLTTIPSTSRLQQNEQRRKIYVEHKDGLKRRRETANNSKQQSLTHFPICNLQHQDHTQATQNFRKQIDALSIMHTCTG